MTGRGSAFFLLLLFCPLGAFAQTEEVSCVNTEVLKSTGNEGYSPSESGLLVRQSTTGCVIASDINAGISKGHQLTVKADNPVNAAQLVQACLEAEGFYDPEHGTKTGKAGFAAALCKCNKAAFRTNFRCSTLDLGGSINASNVGLANDALSRNCIVILLVKLSEPTNSDNKRDGRHATGFQGGTVGPEGEVEIELLDPNAPEDPYSFDIDPEQAEIDTLGPYSFLMGYEKMTPLSFLFKCPELLEGSSTNDFESSERDSSSEPALP